MAQAKAKKLIIAAAVLLFAGTTAIVVQQILPRQSSSAAPDTKSAAAAPAAATAASEPAAQSQNAGKVLVFRHRPSWNRQPDFEDVLVGLGIDFEVKPPDLMATTDLSRYRAVIIPGAQSASQFYAKYIENAARFDEYVTNGGTLLLELNGAERSGLPMPRGVNMIMSPAQDNAITVADHPILLPMGGQIIRANFASHGYLSDLPSDALVLAAEASDGKPISDRPTFAEYTSGKGRVLAACQCFHDRDGSGRGPMMETALTYATQQNWYVAKK